MHQLLNRARGASGMGEAKRSSAGRNPPAWASQGLPHPKTPHAAFPSLWVPAGLFLPPSGPLRPSLPPLSVHRPFPLMTMLDKINTPTIEELVRESCLIIDIIFKDRTHSLLTRFSILYCISWYLFLKFF